MGRFNGNNNQSALRQFLERTSFSADAYGAAEDGILPLPVKDFNFGEYVLYGRIDKMHDPIQLNIPTLAPLPGQPPGGMVLQAANFVADALGEFLSQWSALAFRGRLNENDAYLYDLAPQRAFLDYRESYIKYQLGLRQAFFSNYLTPERNQSIINFDTFLDVFLGFLLEISDTMPVTRTAFIPSKYAGPMVSGLCVELAMLDASDDAVKEEFINSPNFEYYKLVAKATGFSIDKQAPWRLVADIASPQMLVFSSRYGQNTEERVLDNYYTRVGGSDIEELQRLAFDFYQVLLANEPVVRTSTTLACVHEEEDFYITRNPLSLNRLIEEYNFSYWLDTYINIRYNEQQRPLSVGALQEIRRVAPNINQNMGAIATLTYINNNIKTFDNFKGSFASRVLDRTNSLNNTNVQPTY